MQDFCNTRVVVERGRECSKEEEDEVKKKEL